MKPGRIDPEKIGEAASDEFRRADGTLLQLQESAVRPDGKRKIALPGSHQDDASLLAAVCADDLAAAGLVPDQRGLLRAGRYQEFLHGGSSVRSHAERVVERAQLQVLHEGRRHKILVLKNAKRRFRFGLRYQRKIFNCLQPGQCGACRSVRHGEKERYDPFPSVGDQRKLSLDPVPGTQVPAVSFQNDLVPFSPEGAPQDSHPDTVRPGQAFQVDTVQAVRLKRHLQDLPAPDRHIDPFRGDRQDRLFLVQNASGKAVDLFSHILLLSTY